MPNHSVPPKSETAMRALIDFECLDPGCLSTVQCNLMQMEERKGRISCPQCRREYRFDPKFRDKLRRFRNLILAIREAEDLLGDVSVGVTTTVGEERIPYRLLLTRLNTLISLEFGGRKVDFRFRVETPNGEFK
ncbi:MAG: hypothetical protein ACOCUY_02205 [Verrucomicrobiota bacterium]